MKRRTFLSLPVAAAVPAIAAPKASKKSAPGASMANRRRTKVEIKGDQFFINGKPTYAGRSWEGHKIEGLLMNARTVQAIFDDENPETVSLWKYPDTGRWDAQRNTDEFVAALPEWRRHGLLSFNVCLQGGNPQGYRKDQPWKNNAFRPDGTLKPAYMARLQKVLDAADRLGMAPQLCLFYFGQDQYFEGEEAIRRGVRSVVRWLHARNYRNLLLEMANECNNGKYEQAILKPERIVELFDLARDEFRGGYPYPVGTSLTGGKIPPANIVEASDYLLLHGNGVKEPKRIGEMVQETRKVAGYYPMPILFNEDDHFDFDKPVNNYTEAVRHYASWGILDVGENNYRDGHQSPPVNWGLSTERKKQFFALTRRITMGSES